MSKKLVPVEHVHSYLTGAGYPVEASDNQKRAIRNKAKKFVVKNGELHYMKKGKKKQGKSKSTAEVRYVKEREEQYKILHSCHLDPTSGHMGVKRTLARITERFAWPGVSKDVKHLVSTCSTCQKGNRKMSVDTPELHPIPVKSPWFHLGVDFIGPVTTSAKGNRFILTISDYCTKWVEAVALGTKCASATATAMFKIFMRMGIPHVVTTDQGSEFRNQLGKELMAVLKIQHRLTTAYHPQANGLDERFNQTIQTMLSKFVEDKKEAWDDYLDSCVFAYNTSCHESTCFTPFELMFGRKAYLPIEVNSAPENLLKEWQLSDSTIDFNDLTEIQKHHLEKAKSNIMEAQKKQKHYYDLKHANPSVFDIGAKVLLKDFTRKKRKGGKLDKKWLGPFVIRRNIGKGIYIISSTKSPKESVRRVTGSHLKLFLSPSTSFDNAILNNSVNDFLPYPSDTSSEVLSSTLNEDDKDTDAFPNATSSDSLALETMNSPLHTSTPVKEANFSSPETSLDLSREECCSNDKPSKFVEVLQKLPLDDLMSKFSAQLPDLKAMKSQYFTSSVRERNQLKNASNTICCLTSEQMKAVCDFLVHEFCPKETRMKNFSYTLDVIYPEGLQRIVMNMFNLNREEALKVMYTSLPLTLAPSESLSKKEKSSKMPRKVTMKSCEEDCQVSPQQKHSGLEKAVKKRFLTGSVPASKRCKLSLGNHLSGTKSQQTLKNLVEKPSQPPFSDKPSQRIDVDTCPDKPVGHWISDLSLSLLDKNQLCDDSSWLTDKHIRAANKLLAQQFPAQEGLQDSLVLSNFSIFKSGAKEFVQIINISNQHWVCASNKLSSPGVIEVYDSARYTLSSLSLKQQIAAIVMTSEKNFTLHHIEVQRQVGSTDCALFSIAFASTLCMGGDPHLASYSQEGMRAHLLSCFENKEMLPFPSSRSPRKLGRKRLLQSSTVSVFCTCRMPWDKHNSANGPLVQCQICREWFHQACMEIDQKIVDYPALKYNCKLCLGIYDV